MNAAPALYVGWVRHRRMADVAHAFRQPLFLCWLDLAAIPQALQIHRWWRFEKTAPASFCRRDYLGNAAVPLDQAVRDAVQARLGWRPSGPIRILTSLRYWGLSFNPVSFYYCYDAAGETVVAVLAEITNIPWGERHHYVVDGRSGVFAKQFHVSPFQGMDLAYCWQFNTPATHLGVHMINRRAGDTTFDATLALRRLPWTTGQLTRIWFRFPAMTAMAVVGIYLQAWRLWRKRAPFHDHPHTAA